MPTGCTCDKSTKKILAENTHDLRTADSQSGSAVVIVPVGATEQHGPNGLIGTDHITAEVRVGWGVVYPLAWTLENKGVATLTLSLFAPILVY